MPFQSEIELKVRKEENVAIVEMHGGENRINMMFVDKYMEALDTVESWPDVKALITTGVGKFYGNGLDLNYLMNCDQDELLSYKRKAVDLQIRFLTFPMPTIAAINGHCFAGAYIFALSHDYRIMQTGKGWVCLNEVDINMRYPTYPLNLIKYKINQAHVSALAIFGDRFTAEKAKEMGIIDRICPQGEVVESAIKMANELTYKRTYTRESLQNMKKYIYRPIIEAEMKIPSKL